MLEYFKLLHRIWNAPGNKPNRVSALARSISWFFYKRLIKKTLIKTVFKSRQFNCHPDGFISNSIMHFSEWAEYDTLKFIDSFLREEDNFLDIGANVGLFTLLASCHIKRGNIICIEPGAIQRLRLLAHLEINNVKAEVFPFAVSDEEKIVSFTKGDAVAHVSLDKLDNGPLHESVQAKRLDSFCPKLKYHLMKIDVEGFELQALKGATELMTTGLLPVIIFELNGSSERYGIPTSALINYLRDNGYTLGIYSHNTQVFDTRAQLHDDIIGLNEEGLSLLKTRLPGVKIL